MRILLAFLFVASTAFAQSQPAPASCGPENIKFETKMDPASYALAQPAPGKALVYVIEAFQKLPGEFGTPTIRVGLDGAWVGANHGSSHISFSVAPGEHHLCTNWQSSIQRLSSQYSLSSLNAVAGKTYFFRVQVRVESLGDARESWYIDLQPLDPDEATYLLASSPTSVSQPKK